MASQIINKETFCKTCGKTGHHRTLCRHRNQICNYCKVKGHIESYCLNKKKQDTQNSQSKQERQKNKSFIKQKNVNAIENSNNTSKFHKEILLNGNYCKAFVDLGSECSLVKSSVADKFNFQIYDLENAITLSGFLGSGTTVTQYIRATTQIDSVVLDIEYYVVEDIEFKFDILIGTNFTENSNIVYYRIDDHLRFDYKTFRGRKIIRMAVRYAVHPDRVPLIPDTGPGC
ncbi:unnamed protein product [Callosobruchus maculatus]|uniref:Peptidase A2B Ty3 transposon peptidase domain-containing protein n=1 Tax=Callosobruchus maculatus TaxID=64391 RepID=A0A653DCE4_CALMS|nr:unnamed protein product [Callosobruchus maculatus]